MHERRAAQQEQSPLFPSFPRLATQTALVTGGGGFIGKALVLTLHRMGIQVRVLGRHPYPDLEALGIACIQGDIRDAAKVREAVRGAGCVFHVAAKAGIWGARAEYMAINYQGSLNVLEACANAGVPVLIHTSTPSVVFDQNDLAGVDERQSYARKQLCAYGSSKILAERAILSANSATLKTTAIRPHLVWGPGDRNLIPRLLERARAGRLAIVGQGDNRVDITYIDNAVLAHLLAAENLLGAATAAGEAFFIGQEEPVRLWQWINELLVRLDIPPVTRRVPLSLAYGAGAVLELIHTLVARDVEPRMTRFVTLQLARSHWFSHAKAARILGYRPIVSTQEGTEQLLAWLRHEEARP